MAKVDPQLIEDLITFSVKSIEWCAKESEQSARKVGKVMEYVLEDAKRVSSISADTLDVVRDAKETIDEMIEQGKTSQLIVSLQELCNEQVGIKRLIHPIVVALQFQDRISQNMNNLIKMLKLWHELRPEFEQSGTFTEKQKTEFGEKLLDCASMLRERNVIRKHIPSLGEEKEMKDTISLF